MNDLRTLIGTCDREMFGVAWGKVNFVKRDWWNEDCAAVRNDMMSFRKEIRDPVSGKLPDIHRATWKAKHRVLKKATRKTAIQDEGIQFKWQDEDRVMHRRELVAWLNKDSTEGEIVSGLKAMRNIACPLALRDLASGEDVTRVQRNEGERDNAVTYSYNIKVNRLTVDKAQRRRFTDIDLPDSFVRARCDLRQLIFLRRLLIGVAQDLPDRPHSTWQRESLRTPHFQLSKTPVRCCVGVKQGPPLSTLLINTVKLTSSSAAASLGEDFQQDNTYRRDEHHRRRHRRTSPSCVRIEPGRGLPTGQHLSARRASQASPPPYIAVMCENVRLGHQPVRPSGTERALLMMDPAEVHCWVQFLRTQLHPAGRRRCWPVGWRRR
ncbi:hypothetical protein VOLCADRAFT_100259 [Volvox carteri f. nagariensis]|uniref:Uncharacterized protein n=1 Tax=Volvox carteri f. nagariensis TaxID=3068 RepID=D8UJU7_VOLCA|nr:uncharacterized protein VOLCADRAFT_100259 [Volvox carteri f. nagariensis]EFJ40016.1 hypothetical protein VOLCADRAFT_100259 [Volvox carteri f. nagariensis]|eukprot:XP_002958936.1 hypothetical protein VOLCADRAFT_100259 [Volvox carteri f. nagariensis]